MFPFRNELRQKLLKSMFEMEILESKSFLKYMKLI